jgi:uncharacterized protein (TIGR01370 family)
MADGFGGVYLDGVEVYASFAAERPTARSEMLEHIRELAAAARASAPGFLVIVQNAEALLADARYRMLIDGVAKEGLLFDANASCIPNASDESERSRATSEGRQADFRE